MNTRLLCASLMILTAMGCQMFAPRPAQHVLPADDPRIKALASPDEAARVAASESLVAAGAASVPQLVAILDRGEEPAAKMAHHTLLRLAARAPESIDHAPVATALAAALADTELSAGTRNELCRCLSDVGRDESVEALEAAMAEPAIRERARWALARIDTDAATAALVRQLDKADVEFKVALLNALGEHANMESLPALKAAVASDDPAVRAAALDALARIPHADSCETILAAFKTEPAMATDGLLTLIDTLLDAGTEHRRSAKDAIAAMAACTSLTPTQRARLLYASARAGGRASARAVLDALADPNPHVCSAAIEAAAATVGPDIVGLVTEEWGSLTTDTRLRLLDAFGRSGKPAALPALLMGARDAEMDIRVAAFQAIGRLNADGAVATLIAAVQGPPAPDRDAAEAALARLGGDNVTERLIQAYADASADEKTSLLAVLSWRQHPDVAGLLLAAATGDNLELHIVAATGLRRHPSAAAAAVLTADATTGPAELRQIAVESLLGMAWRTEAYDPAAAATMYMDGLKLARDDEQRRTALGGIGRVVDPTVTELLPQVRPWMATDGVRTDAAMAAGALAMRLPESQKEEAVAVLTEAVALRPDNTRAMVKHLRALGVDIDLARDAGCVTSWWFIGPFTGDDAATWKTAYFPEKDVDLAAGGEADGKTFAWKHHRTQDFDGIVNLWDAVGAENHAVAYAYAEIIVAEAQDVVLRLGSDDGIIVWLNGEPVHANPGPRACSPDQDRAAAHLTAGTNRILVKVQNRGSQWAFCLRLTTPGDAPVKFEQRMP
ncbi:MAG: HEAT repeat domain-containing protein [Phycisphaerae bacterium]|nr:HEAT repeat domain-containing protein [Phycisphaerae bacterium]